MRKLNKTEQSIIKLLSKGLTQKEIATELVGSGLIGTSLSTIEKFIKQLKFTLDAKTNFQLAIKLERAGLIK